MLFCVAVFPDGLKIKMHMNWGIVYTVCLILFCAGSSPYDVCQPPKHRANPGGLRQQRPVPTWVQSKVKSSVWIDEIMWFFFWHVSTLPFYCCFLWPLSSSFCFFHRARLLIVMEMMEGGELFHRISQHRHFTEKMASEVTKQVGEDTHRHKHTPHHTWSQHRLCF